MCSRDEILGLIGKSLSVPDCACLEMQLVMENQSLGALVLFNNRQSDFTGEHARLLAMLREHFSTVLANILRYRELVQLKEQLDDDKQYFERELRRLSGTDIVGANKGLAGVMNLVRQVAPLSSPVLLLGETGVGKEVIAGAIHQLSPRQDGPLIKVNCGAIPETLIDSELFGHEKGAFTGAVAQKRGRFERADGGTIFLDEVGELPPEAQVRLLRVLQEKEIERVGGTQRVKVDIRVIAATNRDLEAMTGEGDYRRDLYFRLNVFPIHIPPLRERLADIPALVEHFLKKKSREIGLNRRPELAPGAIACMQNYNWPGNVRELENMVERALILAGGGPVDFSALAAPCAAPPAPAPGDEGPLLLDDIISNHIRRVLHQTNGRIEGRDGAAEILGIKPSTLRQRMRKLGVPFGRKVTAYR